MKKLLTCLLVLSFFADLSSCGLNPEIRRVTDLIENLGEITEASGDAIAEAEAAYDNLSEGAQKKVSNHRDLVSARTRYEEILAENAQEDFRQDYIGEWTELSSVLPAFTPIVSWFGPLALQEDGVCVTGRGQNTWTISEDRSVITVQQDTGKLVLNVLEDDDYVRLIQREKKLVFIRSEEIDDYIQSRFVMVEITPENLSEYIAEPEYAGPILDEKNRQTGEGAWIQPSPAYEKGLVYYGRSEDFSYTVMRYGAPAASEITLRYPYDSIADTIGTRFGPGSHAQGTLIYLRAEYVANNAMTDSRTRTLTLSDGTKHTTSQNWYVDILPYAEHPY